MKLEEFVGSLLTYELHLHKRKMEKGLGTVFKAKKVEIEEEDYKNVNDKQMAMLNKQFKKFLKENKKGRNSRPQPP